MDINTNHDFAEQLSQMTIQICPDEANYWDTLPEG